MITKIYSIKYNNRPDVIATYSTERLHCRNNISYVYRKVKLSPGLPLVIIYKPSVNEIINMIRKIEKYKYLTNINDSIWDGENN